MINQYGVTIKKKAVAAEKQIGKIAGFPWISNNGKTGKAAQDKQQTLRWASIAKRATDGKYYFEALADSDFSGVPDNIIEKFNTDYPHTIEEKQSDWVEG